MDNTEYLRNFEKQLLDNLLKLCTEYKMLDGVLLQSDDVTARWEELALEYIADAVTQINEYPTVAIAWAGYMGMAVANNWDSDWAAHSHDEYRSMYGPNGFDDMDEYIVQNILGLTLDSVEAKQIMNILLCCAQQAVTFIRHEQIEHQTVKAFHIFARTVKVMFRIGAALQLKRLGYKFQKVDLSRAGMKPLS